MSSEKSSSPERKKTPKRSRAKRSKRKPPAKNKQSAAVTQTQSANQKKEIRAEESEKKNVSKPAPNKPTRPAKRPFLSEFDDYTAQVYYDKKTSQFCAGILEIPSLSVRGHEREDTLEELRDKLESHLGSARQRGDRPAPPLQGKQYPEKLEVTVSQGLYRRLDLVSKQERVPLENLVSELLGMALERRDNSKPQKQQQQGRNDSRNNQNHRHGNRGGRDNRRFQNNQNYNRGNQGQRGDNFLEYVRSLEKGRGGGGGGWKKR